MITERMVRMWPQYVVVESVIARHETAPRKPQLLWVALVAPNSAASVVGQQS